MKKINLEGEFGWEINSKNSRQFLDEAKGDDLDVHIASPGGSVFEGLKVFNDFRDYKRKYPNSQNMLTVKGLAASMASYFTMNPAFDMVWIEDNAILMIHNPIGGVAGDYRDAARFAEMLKGLTDLLAQAYSRRTGKSQKNIRDLMDNESWFFGDEIVKSGFADDIIQTEEEKNKTTAIANAQLQFKETERKIKSEIVDSDIFQEIAAMIKFDKINFNDDDFIQKLYDEGESIFHTSDVRMPYPNEHAARIRDPKDFQQDSFRRKNIETGIDIIIGRLKGKTTTTTQAYRFKKSKFTAAEAKKWLKDHNIKYMSFEAASGSEDKTEQDPANARDNNINQEVKSMTLKEFLEQNPAAKIEYDDALKESFDAGKKEVQDVIVKASPFLNNPEYPKQITEVAISVIKGEKAVDVLDSMAATADMIKELQKSKDAANETPPDAKPDDSPNNLSEEYRKTGEIMNQADMDAEISRTKIELGMEVN